MGLFDIFKKKHKPQENSEQIDLQKHEPIETIPLDAHSTSMDIPPIIPEKKKLDVHVPEKIGDFALVYHYGKIPFIPSNNAQDEIEKMQEQNDWELIANPIDGKIHAFHEDVDIGIINGRQQMILDWLKRKDLLKIWLENFGDDGNYVFLGFYRDEQKYLSHRESTVVKLTRYTNEAAQDALFALQDGTKLEFDENYDYNLPEDTICITYIGSAIGALPKKTAQRYIEEGAAAVFLDHTDYDMDKEKEVPFVKIYW